MRRAYVMTPARRMALRKAQLISANKRRKSGLYSGKVGHITYTSRTRKIIPGYKSYLTTAAVGPRLVGYAGSFDIPRNKTLLTSMYIVPKHRGRGVSKRMLLTQQRMHPTRKLQIIGFRTNYSQGSVSKYARDLAKNNVQVTQRHIGSHLHIPLLRAKYKKWLTSTQDVHRRYQKQQVRYRQLFKQGKIG